MTADFYRHFTALIGDVDEPACCTTLRTEERYFTRILRDIGAVESTSEVRRNRPDQMRGDSDRAQLPIRQPIVKLETRMYNRNSCSYNGGVGE